MEKNDGSVRYCGTMPALKVEGLLGKLKASGTPVFKKLGEDLEKEKVAGTTGTYEDSGSSHTDHGTYNDK